jgi:hypothetical protein
MLLSEVYHHDVIVPQDELLALDEDSAGITGAVDPTIFLKVIE